MSDWKKMTKEQKAKRNARRRALHAERKAAAEAKAKKDAAKVAPCKCGKKHPCKKCAAAKKPVPTAEPKNTVHVDGEELSLSENAVLNAVRLATDERMAIEKAIARIGKHLLKLQRAIKPTVNYIKFMVDADGNFNGYYGNSTKPAKKSPAKKAPAKK